MLVFLYLSKYLDYDGSHIFATTIQCSLFYIGHHLIKSLLICFGVDIEEFHHFSFPESKLSELKSYVMTVQNYNNECIIKLKDSTYQDKFDFK